MKENILEFGKTINLRTKANIDLMSSFVILLFGFLSIYLSVSYVLFDERSKQVTLKFIFAIVLMVLFFSAKRLLSYRLLRLIVVFSPFIVLVIPTYLICEAIGAIDFVFICSGFLIQMFLIPSLYIFEESEFETEVNIVGNISLLMFLFFDILIFDNGEIKHPNGDQIISNFVIKLPFLFAFLFVFFGKKIISKQLAFVYDELEDKIKG